MGKARTPGRAGVPALINMGRAEHDPAAASPGAGAQRAICDHTLVRMSLVRLSGSGT
jgi:hypothetical protein